MRLFLALDVDDQVREALYALQNYMKGLGMKGSYVPVSNLHVTMRFLGETGLTDKIGLAMERAVNGIKPFTLYTDRCGAFSNTAVVLLKGETKEMRALYANLEDALLCHGFAREPKPLKPHITLSRRTAPLKTMLQAMDEKLQKTAFYIDHITLYESVRDKGGMVYRPLRETKF